MALLYIHIPFCRSRCKYCDFYKSTSYSKYGNYLEALEREMEFRKDFFDGEIIDTIYFGGGTPSLIPPPALQSVIAKVRTMWNVSQMPEITIELNPDDASEQYLKRLKETDVNRLSFGIQSFIDRDLQFMGRRHTAEQALNAVQTAKSIGFDNITLDLIFGIPGMSTHEWESNIDTALRLGVQHISAYHLTIEPETAFGLMVDDGEMEPVEDTVSEEQYLMLHRKLTRAGFDHYEISNYSLGADRRSRHNSSYWKGIKYLGLGPSAHSFDGDSRSFVVSRLLEYLDGAGTDSIYESEALTRTDKYNEFVMVRLRTSDGVPRDMLSERFGIEALLYFEFMAEKFIQRGLLVLRDNCYSIPPEKFMLSNAVISELFYTDDE